MMRATIQRVLSLGLPAVVAALLSACGGGSDNPAPAPASTSTSFNVGGTVSGLAGSGLQLRLNGGAALAVTTNGVFSFPAQLAAGTSYAVTVVQQPTAPTQLCSVANGSGTVAGTVINIQVTCVTQVTVGGTVSGLTGSSLQLSLNGGAPLAISADGGFSFPQAVAQGTAYTVAVAQQPSIPAQICSVTNASGVAGASNITDVQVSCVLAIATVGGVVQGLVGTGLQLSLNGGAALPLFGSGAFSFPLSLPLGTAYTVTVAQQPNSGVLQTCTVVNGTGTVTSPVTNVQINCPPPAPTGLAVAAGQKQLQFSWANTSGTVSYQLQRQVAGGAWADDGPAMPVATMNTARDVAVHRTDWATTRYRLSACNDGGCTPSADIPILSAMLDTIVYAKASNTEVGDFFGFAVSLSADGSTLAVGAVGEASSATGVNGDQNNESAGGSGAVYVFVRGGGTWSQQAYLKASNTGADDFFGSAVSLSADGNTLAVGAQYEDSSATGVNGNQANNGAIDSGAVYVFVRAGSTWSQQAYLKASNTRGGDLFGYAVSLSADGSTLAVGAIGEDSSATGVNGNQANNGAIDSGAVYVFVRGGGTWSQQAYLKASNTGAGDLFGTFVSLSADGNTLAVGAQFEDSSATGVNGNQGDSSAPNSGAVYVFVRAGSTWSQQAYLKASNTGAGDLFGTFVSLSADGSTLAVGAVGEDSSATGVNGNQANNGAIDSGAVYVFVRGGSTWSQQAYLKASNTGASDVFGSAVSLSADGSTLAVGAWSEASSATGVNGDQNNESASGSGAAYVFVRAGSTWSQQAYLKASNTEAFDFFGTFVSLSADGSTLAVAARFEGSSATGVNGNRGDNSAPNSGAVYVY
jgi:hypothetical protein